MIINNNSNTDNNLNETCHLQVVEYPHSQQQQQEREATVEEQEASTHSLV